MFALVLASLVKTRLCKNVVKLSGLDYGGSVMLHLWVGCETQKFGLM